MINLKKVTAFLNLSTLKLLRPASAEECRLEAMCSFVEGDLGASPAKADERLTR